jgi:putative sporulation protein YyaC
MFKRIEDTPPVPLYRESYQNAQLIEQLSFHLYSTLLSKSDFYDIVVLCIGTDRSTGDALGPIVGSRLQKLYLENITVYGTLDDPIHALNLEETIEKIHNSHNSPYIIAIDACLGELKSVGMVTLAQGPLKPGAGVQKKLPEIGDIHLTGIVNVGGFMEYFVLQNTRLSIVMKMGDKIASAIYYASLKLKRKGTLHQKGIPLSN